MSFSDFIAAAEKGAASIYHEVLATGVAILDWAHNPAVASLVEVGVGTANGMLQRSGAITEATGTVVADDIHAALKHLAALDPTVASIGTLASTVVSTLIPGAGPLINIAEEVVALAEARS